MVFRKRKGGKRAGKKTWRKRKQVNVNKALQPIPQRYICKLKYSQSFAVSSLSTQYKFNLNSIFDPDATGIGHQPYAHDTLQSLYNRYRVISCKYVITAYNSSNPIRMVALPANEIVSSDVSSMVENPRARFMVQYPGGNTNKLRGSVYMPSLVGRSKAQYMADDRYQATYGSSPLEGAILNVSAASITDIPVDNTVMTIELIYTVESFDVKNLSAS